MASITSGTLRVALTEAGKKAIADLNRGWLFDAGINPDGVVCHDVKQTSVRIVYGSGEFSDDVNNSEHLQQ